MKSLYVLGDTIKLQLSPSFLQNAACPAYMKYHYVDRLDAGFIRIAAERGKTAHEAVAELTKHCMEERIPVQALENEMLRVVLEKHLPVVIINETELILSWLKLWRDRFKLPNNIHGIEEKIAIDDEYEECDWKDASYRGIVDLAQISGSHAIITDLKSQAHIMGQTELDGHEQGTMYCWLVQKMYPHVKTFTFRIWYLRYGFYAETERSEEDLAAFEEALMIREEKISQMTDWDPIPGKHCQYCDFIHICPLAQDRSPANPEIITQEQAFEAARRITVMDALSKELKGKLKIYVNRNDAILIGNRYQYGYHHKTSDEWEVEAVETLLMENGHKLSEVGRVDVKAMKKLLKVLAREDPQLEEALGDLKKEKHVTEFKGGQVGTSEEGEEA